MVSRLFFCWRGCAARILLVPARPAVADIRAAPARRELPNLSVLTFHATLAFGFFFAAFGETGGGHLPLLLTVAAFGRLKRMCL
jgi:hypothetical protein